MKTIIKPISILLSALMLMSVLLAAPFTVSAAEIVDSGKTGACTWTLDNEGTLTISGTGTTPDYMVPDENPWQYYNNYNNYNIKTIKIEGGVVGIGLYSFSNCYNLESVYAQGVRNIRDGAFKNCINLKSITAPDVQMIGDNAFTGCALQKITLPRSIKEIGAKALGYKRLKKITNFTIYGYSETAAETYADNNRFNFIPLAGENCTYTMDDENNLKITKIDPDKAASVGNPVFQNNAEIKTIEIGEGVIEIGDGAFAGCKFLTSVTIYPRDTNINDSAFWFCDNLTTIKCYKDSTADNYAQKRKIKTIYLDSTDVTSGDANGDEDLY